MKKIKNINKVVSPLLIKSIVTGISIGSILFITIINIPLNSISDNLYGILKTTPTLTQNEKTVIIQNQVTPDKIDLGVSFGTTIKKLVEYGAIDKQKFLNLYSEKGGLPEEFNDVLDNNSAGKIILSKDNSAIILNLLWPLGISNVTDALSNGPMAEEYKKTPDNFASTGGWTLGRLTGGKLYNRFPILPLDQKQNQLVSKIAQNIYRPCCDEPTDFPDCNHGAAMLGFIELAVSQGMSEKDIYKKALALNSYWFPQTYLALAIYFKNEKNIDWTHVDPQIVLGSTYSGGTGFTKINQELQKKGLIPKVNEGSACSV